MLLNFLMYINWVKFTNKAGIDGWNNKVLIRLMLTDEPPNQ